MYIIILPVLMGLEAVVKEELLALGFSSEAIELSNGQVSLRPKQDRLAISRAIALCNVHLACAERVELCVAEFPAEDFDALFEGVKALDWSLWIPKKAAFTVVRGYSNKSNLFAPPAIQSTIKKGIVLSLQRAWGLRKDSKIEENKRWLELAIKYYFHEDIVRLVIDTSGPGLHRRGYRTANTEAPISETLAAGIIRLSRFEPFSGELLYDPFCGSGTFPIEAAMYASGVKPGTKRSFTAEKWPLIGQDIFAGVKQEALAGENTEDMTECFIAGSDISRKSIAFSKLNAERAGVAKLIDFSVKNVNILDVDSLIEQYRQDRVLFLANPPYGERMATEKEVEEIHQTIGNLIFYPQTKFTKPGVRASIITTADFEGHTGHKADKRRKLYNGMMECTMYHYFREKYL